MRVLAVVDRQEGGREEIAQDGRAALVRLRN